MQPYDVATQHPCNRSFFAVTIDADVTGFEECSSAAMPTDTHAPAADTLPDAAALHMLDSCEHANTLHPPGISARHTNMCRLMRSARTK